MDITINYYQIDLLLHSQSTTRQFTPISVGERPPFVALSQFPRGERFVVIREINTTHDQPNSPNNYRLNSTLLHYVPKHNCLQSRASVKERLGGSGDCWKTKVATVYAITIEESIGHHGHCLCLASSPLWVCIGSACGHSIRIPCDTARQKNKKGLM